MSTTEFKKDLLDLLGDCEQVFAVDWAKEVCKFFEVPLNHELIEHDFFFGDDLSVNTLMHGGNETGISTLHLSFDLCKQLGIDAPGAKYSDKSLQASANKRVLEEWLLTHEARVIKPEVLPAISEIDPRLAQVVLTITQKLSDEEMASLEIAIATGADPRKHLYYEKVSELFQAFNGLQGFDGTKMSDQVRAVFRADLERRIQRRTQQSGKAE